jgi:CheY-like chemotaxis protein
LVAEEHAESLVLMLHALKGRGYSTVFATTASEVVRLAREERPDVVVCQWHLSNADGSKVARQFLKEERLRNIPLLAVVDAPRPEVGGLKTPAGFVDHIARPIDPESFIKTVERHIPPPLRVSRTPVRPRGLRRKSDPMQTSG